MKTIHIPFNSTQLSVCVGAEDHNQQRKRIKPWTGSYTTREIEEKTRLDLTPVEPGRMKKSRSKHDLQLLPCLFCFLSRFFECFSCLDHLTVLLRERAVLPILMLVVSLWLLEERMSHWFTCSGETLVSPVAFARPSRCFDACS